MYTNYTLFGILNKMVFAPFLPSLLHLLYANFAFYKKKDEVHTWLESVGFGQV